MATASTREDLLFVAEQLAAKARARVDPADSAGENAAVPLVHAARSALDAAALVDVEPGPVAAAFERLVDELAAHGVDTTLPGSQSSPAVMIDATVGIVAFALQERAIGAAVQHGYAVLRGLVEGLERDFAAADTHIAARTAARLHAGLEEAEQAIRAARGQDSEETRT
jgi:hypothetical protein